MLLAGLFPVDDGLVTAHDALPFQSGELFFDFLFRAVQHGGQLGIGQTCVGI